MNGIDLFRESMFCLKEFCAALEVIFDFYMIEKKYPRIRQHLDTVEKVYDGLSDPEKFKTIYRESFEEWFYGNEKEEDEAQTSMVRLSKYTPNLKNGKGVAFQIGDKVKYRMRNGEEHTITIKSELMKNSGWYGYEALFDDGVYAFAVEQGIYDWDGKR